MVLMDTRKVWLKQPGVENGWGSTDIKTIQRVWKPELTWIYVSAGQEEPSLAHSHKFLTSPEQCRTDKSSGKQNPQKWNISHLDQPWLLQEKQWGEGGGKAKKGLKPCLKCLFWSPFSSWILEVTQSLVSAPICSSGELALISGRIWALQAEKRKTLRNPHIS